MDDWRGQQQQWQFPRPAPPPYESGWTAGMKSLTAVVITLVIGLLVTLTVVLVRQGRADVAAAAPERYTAYVPPAVTTEEDTATPEHTTPRYRVPDRPSTTTVTEPAPESALSLLRGQVEADRAEVSALVGYWLPQLSAKQPGLVVRGETYDHRRIWADYQANKQRYPRALLLWSGDFSSFKHADFWITVVPETFASGEAANGWCVTEGIGKDDCYAKRLSHTGGYEGNTLVRK